MKNFLLTVSFSLWTIVTIAQENLTTGSALYFNNSGNAPDGFPYARFTENYGIRFNSPDSRWVFSSKPSVLIGYTPLGENWGNDNLLVYGKVGIGTTNALEKLTVMGNVHLPLGNSLGFIQSTDYFNHDGKAVGNYSLGWYNDSWQGGAPSSYYSGFGGIKFFTQANLRMAIDYWGNVGIGTNSPTQKLEVAGVIQSSNAGINIGPSNTAIASDGFSLYLKAAGTTYLNTSSNAYITNSGGASFSGNVGIGTNNPPQQFSLTGGIGFANQNAFDKKLYSPIDGLLEWMTHNSASDHAFAVSHQGEKMVYLSSFGNSYLIGGNLGIGTTNPDAKLAVKGTVHAEEVKVDLQVPGPDYVFEPTYQLPSLTEIENYIKTNKHLPEVPSAKEMETNGINLSEMNMLLLKKVEELTLYVIELKKENQDQDQQNKLLKEQIELLIKKIDEKK